MTRNTAALIAGGGSLALLVGAFAFQHIGGFAPCKMCIWQRYPHVIAAALGAIAFFIPASLLLLLGALAALATAGVGFYHAGVEQKWWEGPSTCTAGDVGGLNPEDLLNQILNAPLVRCDDIAWSLAGISMAGWNGILSLCLTGLWIYAFRRNAETARGAT